MVYEESTEGNTDGEKEPIMEKPKENDTPATYPSFTANQQRIPYAISLHRDTIAKIKATMKKEGILNKSRWLEKKILILLEK
jgi:hypothetical protein